MNILFLSISTLPHLSEHSISLDLIHELCAKGHSVYVICSNERRNRQPTALCDENGCKVLRVRTGNNKNTNLIEKGISNLLLPYQYIAAIKKYLSDVKFDLVLYPTPPVTQALTVEYVKKRDGAKSYLLLKDIFPQNAVDIGMMTKTGPKSIIYKTFRRKEKKLYKLSDYIGCMSQANVDYLIKHNPYIDSSKVHIAPNSIEVPEKIKDSVKALEIREKYNIPKDATVFVYGGNLGRPQDIPFVIECLKDNVNKSDRYFVICGKGTEYKKLQAYMETDKPDNVLLINGLPKTEYEDFILSCDVGLVFLDYRFTIPNFPSRLLAYMQNSMPVLACTDVNTDVGEVIEKGDFGWWCPSNDASGFTQLVDKVCMSDLVKKGENAKKYLMENYTIDKCYEKIMEYVQG